VLQALFMRLAPEGHELVLYDVNRHASIAPLIARPVEALRKRLISDPSMPVDVTLVTNANADTNDLVEVRRAAGSTTTRTRPWRCAGRTGSFRCRTLRYRFRRTTPFMEPAQPPVRI